MSRTFEAWAPFQATSKTHPNTLCFLWPGLGTLSRPNIIASTGRAHPILRSWCLLDEQTLEPQGLLHWWRFSVPNKWCFLHQSSSICHSPSETPKFLIKYIKICSWWWTLGVDMASRRGFLASKNHFGKDLESSKKSGVTVWAPNTAVLCEI